MRRYRVNLLLPTVLLVLAGAVVPALTAHADGVSLTDDQRRAYLEYYAPLLLKQGDENNDKTGRDWLTNFDFDRDGDFSTNRANWMHIPDFAASAGDPAGPYAAWKIRPTLYTAVLQYRDTDGSTAVTLLYHVYNAADKDGDQIHDWERVEITIRGVTGTPGGVGESFATSVLTHHKEHILRSAADLAAGKVRFRATGGGNHLLLWQADESDVDLPSLGPHGHELRYVTDDPAAVPGAADSSARVHISGANESYRVHYVFAPADAVPAMGASVLTHDSAGTLASGVDNGTTVPWGQTKRIAYELQDLADIIPTHWAGGDWSRHWRADDSTDILLESPITDESGAAVVPVGRQHFNTASKDGTGTDGRDGIPSKGWLYGDYSAEGDEDTPSGSDDFGGYEGDGKAPDGSNRATASGDAASLGAYWRQHDFFVHDGGLIGSEHTESGRWLPAGWAAAESGGFDGRWVALFDDRPAADS